MDKSREMIVGVFAAIAIAAFVVSPCVFSVVVIVRNVADVIGFVN